GYRELRNQEARVSITYVLVDLVTRLHGVTTELRTSPGQLEATTIERVAALSPEIQSEIASLDLARVERALRLLERYFERHAAPDAQLTALVESRFLHVAFDEGALARFALEAGVIGRVFPVARGGADALGERVAALETRCRAHIERLHERDASARWAELTTRQE
ncbi:MAG: hypothetical protein OEZ06_32155, partial [Myxococcales bacterium]|nr:hypothetical protein [Myxococcales bacterium]